MRRLGERCLKQNLRIQDVLKETTLGAEGTNAGGFDVLVEPFDLRELLWTLEARDLGGHA
jgi:hypothetical protein